MSRNPGSRKQALDVGQRRGIVEVAAEDFDAGWHAMPIAGPAQCRTCCPALTSAAPMLPVAPVTR